MSLKKIDHINHGSRNKMNGKNGQELISFIRARTPWFMG